MKHKKGVVRNVLIGFLIIDLIVVILIMLRPSEERLYVNDFIGKLKLKPIEASPMQIDASGVPIIIVHFNSQCDECQNEAAELSRTMEEFKNTRFILISSEEETVIRQFEKDFHLNAPNITVARITATAEAERFSLPHTFVFGRDGNFIREYRGFTTSNELLSSL